MQNTSLNMLANLSEQSILSETDKNLIGYDCWYFVNKLGLKVKARLLELACICTIKQQQKNNWIAILGGNN